MQRSYNAFAVRLQGEKGTKRRAVPAIETDEGELCIEMRIKLYPDGPMSNLLLQLIKVRRRDGQLMAGCILRVNVIATARFRFRRCKGLRVGLCYWTAGAFSRLSRAVGVLASPLTSTAFKSLRRSPQMNAAMLV